MGLLNETINDQVLVVRAQQVHREVKVAFKFEDLLEVIFLERHFYQRQYPFVSKSITAG